MEKHEIVKNSLVKRKSNPGLFGRLTGRIEALGPRIMAQVDWGASKEYEDIRQLIPAPPDEDMSMEAVLRRAEFGTLDDLRRRITYEKLQGTLTDFFYSMETSRIDFYPHQFKPVLRFVDSPTNRLLIADEVGLGKTIEAGLIWTEWQARHQARRLLVVCPPSLCPKWEHELVDRFQLPAQVLDVDGMLNLLERYRIHGPKLGFVAICSYDSLSPRKAKKLPNGAKLNEKELLDSLVTPPSGRRIDVPSEKDMSKAARFLYRLLEDDSALDFVELAVLDEAHRMKNTATIYHTLGTVLSQVSNGSLCLSATPIHNKSRDLYALLRLVDPDFFRDEYAFNNLIERNQPVVRLLNLLSSNNMPAEKVLELCREISGSPYFRDSRSAQRALELSRAFCSEGKHAVELSHEAEKLNLLGGYLNRTRKVQVLLNRVVRNAMECKVCLTDMEEGFYSSVLRQVRANVRAAGGEVTAFHLIAPALRMSSCIPSMVQCLNEGRFGGWDEVSELCSDLGSEFDAADGQETGMDFGAFQDYDFEANDSKYHVLRNELLHNLDDAKVLVFAFFKDTIRYLERRLNADGIKATSVTGDIKDRDLRNELMQRFAQDGNRVLLLSEIGAEGVDLQFCRTMVNYDLPWNPMRVEQRIGRIDRIGQSAARINIVNLHVVNTLDGRIFELLHQRIGLFSNTIGDLEGILGEEVSRLTSKLLRDELTPQQERTMIENTARAIERRRRDELELETSSGTLMAFRDYLAESVGESQRMGRYVKPAELRSYVDDFLAFQGDGCRADWDTPETDCGRIILSFAAMNRFQQYLRQQQEHLPHGFNGSERSLTLTFDPETYKRQKERYRLLALVNHLNPLIKWITHENSLRAADMHSVCALRCRTATVAPGEHFFHVRRLSITGLHKREKLYYGMLNLATGDMLIGNEAERTINECLLRGQTLFDIPSADYPGCLRRLTDRLNAVCQEAIEDFVDEMEAKAIVQRQQAESHFERKLRIAQNRLQSMLQAGEDRERGIRLTEKQITSLQEQKNNMTKHFENVRDPEIGMTEVCCGLMRAEDV